MILTCGFSGFQGSTYGKAEEEGDSNVPSVIKLPQIKGTLRFTLEAAFRFENEVMTYSHCSHFLNLLETPKTSYMIFKLF